jgi:alpha-glucosidase
MKHLPLYLACLLVPVLFTTVITPATAQDTILPAGDVQNVTARGNQLDITTTHAFVHIQVYSPSIIRVRMSNRPFGDDFSYAVIASPAGTGLAFSPAAVSIHASGPAIDRSSIIGHSSGTPIELTQTAADIRFRTDSLKVLIRKQPFSISFYTPDDRLINEDEKGLGVSWQGTRVTDYKKLQPGERFIGLGEKTSNIDRAGSAYTNWNSDVYGYSVAQDPLYSSIPFYIGIHDSLSYGIFFDNSYRTDFNFGASNNRFSSFGAEGGEMNYYFIYDPFVAGIIRSYTSLTGRMNLPPLWSLGYQQNRYSYYPDAEVLRIAKTLREKQIPADGITLDIHYMDHYKLFTWDQQRFPHPRSMMDQLWEMGFKTTVIVDPGIKVEKGYEAYESGLAGDVFLKYPDGENYTGQVWPGWCNFPDFTGEKGRAWWRKEIRNYTDAGVAGIWNDMNEISTWGQKMPDNVLFNFDGHPTTHLQGHNIFGLEMARSSYEGARAALQKRPFVLSRAGYAGLQRYAAIWTGDNRAEDDHMLAGVRLLTSLGLSGVSFAGMDIGGFTGNPSAGLFTRWIQLGAFIPYYRNHTANNSKAAEPWAFGEDVLSIARKYIDLRYTLLPYLYAQFREASLDGMPVMRSLAIGYTQDPHIYDTSFQNEFLCGASLLVIPEESGLAFAKIYLPSGDWYDAYTGQRSPGGQEKLIELSQDRLPVYVKAGSIIPRQSVIQNTTQAPSDTLDLHCYAGPDPASFSYYEDDGASYNYEKGMFYQRTLRMDPVSRKITLEKPEGQWPSKFHYIRFLLHGFDARSLATDAGTSISLATQQIDFLPGDTNGETVRTAVLPNTNQTLSLTY